MRKPEIAIKLKSTNYSGLVNLGNRVFSSMTGNINFTTPSPTLLALQTAVTDVEDAIAVWGPRSNRGSHADLVVLREKSLTLWQLLKAEAQYVENTAQLTAGNDYAAMAAIMITSGFQLANIPNPQGILQMVQNFHIFVSRKLNPNQAKLKWKKPLNTTAAGNVKSNIVYRGLTSVFSAAAKIGEPTRTNFTDVNATGSPVTWFYWVQPVGAAGPGVVSDVVMVTIPGV